MASGRRDEPETRVITLPDLRDFAFVELGAPDGAPVLAFHGSPGRGLQFLAQHADAAENGLRILAPDRPGYGHSTYFPTRTYRSWADDVAFLADYLALDQFAVFGVSSGGPNAAVCARFIGDRIRGCAVVSSPAPFDPSIADEGMRRMNRIGRRAVRISPRFVAFAASLLARGVTPERAYEYACNEMPPEDLAILRRPDVRAALLHDLARPSSPTALRAAVQDFTLEVHDWGFRLEDIEIPVHVWHGDEDRNVPIQNGLRIATAIPNSTLHRLSGAGHWFSHDRFADVIRQSAN